MIKNPLLERLDNIVHGFGGRNDRMPDIFAAYWGSRPVQHERHGIRIAVVEHPTEDCGEADGMLTSRAGLLLSIATADCVPVLFAQKNGKEVAALHIGWRGAFDSIVQNLVNLIRSRGGEPCEWYAAIGPSAAACCYEVSPGLIKQFRERFDIPFDVMAPRSSFLNLAGIVLWQLERAGFTQVSASSECTICHCESVNGGFSYHSYRRDRETRTPIVDVQWSVIAISNTAHDE
jgi:YfiH family protein